MDLTSLSNLFQGNNGLLILLALFLFKDQLLALFAPKPKPVDPVPVVPPPVVVPVTPEDRPVINAIIKDVLPVLLPVLVALLKEQAKQEPPK